MPSTQPTRTSSPALAAMHAREAARVSADRDAARRRSLRESGLFPARQFRPSTTAEAIAGHMIEIAAGADGACTDADLLRVGFSPSELAQHGQAARQIAYGLQAQGSVEAAA